MAKIHGSNLVVTLDDDDLSAYANNVDYERSADSHDTTTFGADGHVFDGGLTNGTVKVDGFYDSTAGTGPRAVITPLLGTKVTFVHRPEGTGSGLPQNSSDVVVTKYVESSPVADFTKWSLELQISGTVTTTAQSA